MTYPQSDLDNDVVADTLLDKVDSFDPLYIVVSRELHQDGNPHHHALIQLGKKPDITNAAYFDIDDVNGVSRHPNIQKAPRPNATLTDTRNYVIKDGEFVERGEWIEPSNKRKRDDVFAEALTARSRQEAEEIIKAGAPRDWFVAASQITGRLDAIYNNNTITLTEAERSVLTYPDLPDPVWTWYSQHILVSFFLLLSPTKL